MALVQAGCFSAAEWAASLGSAIKQAHAAGDRDDGSTYYNHVLDALEQLALKNRWLRGMFWLPGMRNTSRAFGAQARNVTPASTSVAPMGVSRLTLSLWPSISPPFPLRRFLQVSESSSGLMFSTGRQLNLAMPIDYLSWGKPGYHMIPAWHRRSRR